MSANIGQLVQEVVPAAPIAAKAKRPSRQWLRIVSPVALLLLWQIASSSGMISSRTLAPPSHVLASFWELLSNGELEHHFLVSLGRAGKGLVIAILLGGSLALISGLSRFGVVRESSCAHRVACTAAVAIQRRVLKLCSSLISR
jgi:sulfonate transport system permease protein